MAKHNHLILDFEGEIIGLALPVDAAEPVQLSDFRRNISLNGVKDGINVVFTTSPDKFLRIPFEEVLYYNGVVLEGSGNDYIAIEGGGIGTGYDTIVVSVAPLSWEKLTIDYLKKV